MVRFVSGRLGQDGGKQNRAGKQPFPRSLWLVSQGAALCPCTCQEIWKRSEDEDGGSHAKTTLPLSAKQQELWLATFLRKGKSQPRLSGEQIERRSDMRTG